MKTWLLAIACILPQDKRPAVDIAAARTLLKALGEKQAGIKTLRARYVQERTTPLRKQPLLSNGTLLFRSTPACIVFAVAAPRMARIRLDEHAYEVWRPEERELERFLLQSSDLPRALFQAFNPSLQELESKFAITRCVAASDTALRITLTPREESMKAYLTSLVLVVSQRDAALQSVGYVDGQGDAITITLENLERDPELARNAFDIEVQKDAKVLVHSAGERPGGESAPSRLQPERKPAQTSAPSRPNSEESRK